MEEIPIEELEKGKVQFYSFAQDLAISTFLPLLRPHLPHSNPIYNRIQSPQNLPSRHCLFAATFQPNYIPQNEDSVPYTIIFADRSRHSESQIWIFNPLITKAALSPSETDLLRAHLQSLILFLKTTEIPEAPGWPFSPILKFGCLHEYIASSLLLLGEAKAAVPRATNWNLWTISTAEIVSRAEKRGRLPHGFTVARVPEDQIQLVISTSSIPRQAATLRQQPNVGLMNDEWDLVAWGYIGVDGAFATLYVLPEYRGRGLATCVALELLTQLEKGGFKDLGYQGESGWTQSDVYDGNEASEGVMRALGAKVGWKSSYMWIDSEKF